MKLIPIRLRPAQTSDCRYILEVRNTLSSRKASFNTAPIPFSIHSKWFHQTLKNKNVFLFVITDTRGHRYGTLRIDKQSNKDWEIHIALQPEWQGKGIGQTAVKTALQLLSKSRVEAIENVVARIRPDNPRSIRFFFSLGFRVTKIAKKNQSSSVHMVYPLKQKDRKIATSFLIVCDLGEKIGLGHIMRQLALAEALSALGHPIYFCLRRGYFQKSLSRFIFSKNYCILKKIPDAPFLLLKNIQGVLVDTMQVPSKTFCAPFFQNKIPVILMGNYRSIPKSFTGIVNAYSEPSCADKTQQKAVGSYYAILSDDFEKNRLNSTIRRNYPKKANRILIFPGGGNTSGMVFKILKALALLDKAISVDLLIGSYFTQREALISALQKSRNNITLHQDIAPSKVLHLMQQSDLAIVSYGRSIDEARSVGLPTLVLSSNKINALGARYAAKQGGIIDLGDFKKSSALMLSQQIDHWITNRNKRQKLGRSGLRQIDGKGRSRTLHKILEWTGK